MNMDRQVQARKADSSNVKSKNLSKRNNPVKRKILALKSGRDVSCSQYKQNKKNVFFVDSVLCSDREYKELSLTLSTGTGGGTVTLNQ